MCKIRIITKLNTKLILDNIVDIETSLSVVERPAYIEKISDTNKNEIIFHYSGSTEKYKSIQYNEILVEYGEVSGRIKRLTTNKNNIFPTDIYNLQNIVTAETLPSIRFSSNFKEGLILVDKILKM